MLIVNCIGYTHGNPGPGGLAVVTVQDGEIINTIVEGYHLSTDPRLHLMSLVRGLESVADLENATFKTCSEYVYYTIESRAYVSWLKFYNEMMSYRSDRHNLDLWHELDSYLAGRKINLVYHKKKSGDIFFCQADLLAKEAARKPNLVDEFFEASKAGMSYKEFLIERDLIFSHLIKPGDHR